MSSIYMSIDEIKRRLREGTELEIIAELNGCSKGDIKNMLEKSIAKPVVVTLPKPKDVKQTRKGAPQLYDTSKFMELYDKGLTATEMEEASGATRSTVYRWHKENNLKTNKKPKAKQHKTIVKPTVPKPEQAPNPAPVVEAIMPLAKENEEKEMEKTSTRDIKVKLDPAILDECFQEANQKLRKSFQKPAEPAKRTEWQKYRTAQVADWIAYCANNLLPIDPEFLQEYSEVVR